MNHPTFQFQDTETSDTILSHLQHALGRAVYLQRHTLLKTKEVLLTIERGQGNNIKLPNFKTITSFEIMVKRNHFIKFN